MSHVRTQEQAQAFAQDGYLILPGLFSQEIVELLSKVGRADAAMNATAALREDAQGGQSKLWLNHTLQDDLYSHIARSPRMVDPLEQVLGDEVLHFHHKMMQKEPFVGGAWEWHQDYGYWYKNERFLFPHMASCFIAVDKATKENGCLQVLAGSHHCGRIEHGVAGEQTGAEVDRVEALMQHLELRYAEMEPGDALFFHGNTLHRSDQNKSPNPRWVFICCYATAGNPCIGQADYPDGSSGEVHLTAIDRVDDETILKVGHAQLEALQANA